MFKEFFIKEIVGNFKRPMIYIFLGIITLLVSLAVASSNVVIGSSVGNIHKNAPHIITFYSAILSLFGLLMAVSFFNNAALKDFNNNFNEILFTSPISRFGYFFGRFLGALVTSTIPLIGVFIGFVVGSYIGPALGWIDSSRIGDIKWMTFFNCYLLFILPNMFFSGTVVYAVANKWKSTVISFVGTLVIIMGYLISQTLTSNIDNETFGALIDIFGIETYSIDSKYKTPAEKNLYGATFSGLLVINRAIWLLIGCIILTLSYLSFSFSKKDRKVKKKEHSDRLSHENPVLVRPLINADISSGTNVVQFISFLKVSLNSILKSTSFKLLFLFSTVLVISTLMGGFEYLELKSYPVTYKMIDANRESINLFIIIILVFFSGELVWRDRNNKLNEVVDSTPHSSIISMLAKSTALICITSLLNLFFILLSIGYQLVMGYTNIELSIYLQDFLYSSLPKYIIWSSILIFAQVIINSKYIAYFVSIIVFFAMDIIMLIFDWQSYMINIGSSPIYRYSDMDGFGATLKSTVWFNGYWLVFGIILVQFAGLMWSRGYSNGIGDRLRIAKNQLSKKYLIGLSTSSLIWLSIASIVYYNTQILNTYKTSDEKETLQIEYEKKYKKYENALKPKITSAKYYIDIFPENRKLIARAAFIVQNKSKHPIDSLHFTVDPDNRMTVHLRNVDIILEDKSTGYRIYKLRTAMQPGDRIGVVTEVSYENRGFENRVSKKEIAYNGTFVNNTDILPSFGYEVQAEIDEKSKRKKYGLPRKERMPKLEKNCGKNCLKNYISGNTSEWINVETFISTSSDQLAIAPGSLLKEWKEGDRNHYHYKCDYLSLNFFNFMSARYEVARKKHHGVDIEIYYYKSHGYNIEKMIKAVEKSLDYYTKNFGPYHHKQARIIEFPRYNGSFAQAFAGTMPYSEALGFIVNLEKADENNILDAVIAHEMAHQWWGHQEVSAFMQGGTMLVESFAEYSSLMVMKNAVQDPIKMKDFLEFDFDRYLGGRSIESKKELPLYKVESQGYIHYGKGSVVLYALQDYIGEEKVNKALRDFLNEYKYKGAPYPTSYDFLRHLEPNVPDSLKYLINDWFKEITLYDYRLTDAKFHQLPTGKYEVNLEVQAHKLTADTLGREERTIPNEWVDLGIYSDNDERELTFRKRVKFDNNEMKFNFEVDSLPVKAAIDPYRLIIERIVKDNVRELEEI